MRRLAVVALMCSCLLSVDSVTDPRIPDIFYPFGTDHGDQVVRPGDDGSDPRLPDIFYPFGTDPGDEVAAPSDDGSVPVSVGGNVPFCALTYDTIYLNTNGFISFGKDYKEYSAVEFPIPGCSLLAVYWADVNPLVNNGGLYYRIVNAASNPLLTQASRAIRTAFADQGFFAFQARWLFIATWHNVTFYGGNATTPTNSFQAVIATDWFYSFAMFNYGNLTWMHGAPSNVPAQVGYNNPDGRTYATAITSRTDDVKRTGSDTNVATKGRWMYRLDNNGASGCALPPVSATVPSHSCPTLSGPTVINRLWIEFYCTVNTTATDSRARFNVTFFSDTDAIYSATATPTDRRVTLHERYLLGRLGKRLYCAAVSYWSDNPTEHSGAVRSSSYYVPGIEVIMSPVRATETDPNPVQLRIKSTLPITCQQQDSNGHSVNCQLSFTVFVSSADIAARQRRPGESLKHCTFTYDEADWRPSESRAYDVDAPLEIRAKIDLYVTSPRASEIHFRAPLMSMRNVNGTSYPSMWTGYSVRVAQVYHIDSPSSLVKCTAGGDPHVTTFDGLSYTTLTLGEFTYARSVYGLPYEVQVRHGPCSAGWADGISCICGIAMREDDMILAVDRCNKSDDSIHQISYGMKKEMRGAGTTISADGHSMKLQMPSGGKIIAHVWLGHMNIEIYVPEKIRTNGLCGTYDRNATNDLNYQGSGRVASVGSNGLAPVDVIESWRVYRNASLFAGHLVDLPRGDPGQETPLSFCTCALDQEPECGGFAVADNTSSKWEPSFTVPQNELPTAGQHARKRKAVVDRSDNIDFNYDPTAFYGFLTDRIPSVQWPTRSGVTESQARDSCTSRIVTRQFMGSSCYNTLTSTVGAAQVVQKCVGDFMIMDNLALAADDKIPELQQACINELVTRNRSDIRNTFEVMAQVISILPTVTAFKCEPYDCSGHGACSNGTCVCSAGFVGTDCRVYRSAVPSIIRLLDPPICDINTRLCWSVSMVTANRTSSVRCRILVGKMNAESATYNTPGQVTSLKTMSCSLPLEPLSLYDNNFTALHGPGFDFSRLPHGGAVLTYTVTISNDGVRYSEGQTMKVVDTLCMECNATACTQKTDACLINGYCFAHLAMNPYDSTLYCLTDVSTTSWSSMNHTRSKPVETKYEDSDSNGRSAVVPSVTFLVPEICDYRSPVRMQCQYVTMVTTNINPTNGTSKLRCKVVVTKMNNLNAAYITPGKVTSLNRASCYLPRDPMSLYETDYMAGYGPSFDFSELPFGGAVLTLTVSISNDGKQYSSPQTMKVVDSWCMQCNKTVCVQKADTCLINGYCFNNSNANLFDPTASCLRSNSTVSTYHWHRGDTSSVSDTVKNASLFATTIMAIVVPCAVVLIALIAVAVVVAQLRRRSAAQRLTIVNTITNLFSREGNLPPPPPYEPPLGYLLSTEHVTVEPDSDIQPPPYQPSQPPSHARCPPSTEQVAVEPHSSRQPPLYQPHQPPSHARRREAAVNRKPRAASNFDEDCLKLELSRCVDDDNGDDVEC